MKRTGIKRERNAQLFGMSFLDVICCGFGAMVLLVLLSKTDIAASSAQDSSKQLSELVRAVLEANQTIDELTDIDATLRARQQQLREELQDTAPPDIDLDESARRLVQARQRLAALQRAARTTQTASSDDAVKVGGIPVDSNHVVFIIDTSGSMARIWSKVIAELENILDIHPRVTGFQVMSDNGDYLIDAYARRWIPDTAGRRAAALELMRNWRGVSNSSPAEGLELALRTYAKRTDKLAVYVFGDDYAGNSYADVLTRIAKYNRDAAGQPLARIHGIGFGIDVDAAERFATLMREVARQNRGAFIGEPLAP